MIYKDSPAGLLKGVVDTTPRGFLLAALFALLTLQLASSTHAHDVDLDDRAYCNICIQSAQASPCSALYVPPVAVRATPRPSPAALAVRVAEAIPSGNRDPPKVS